MKFRPTKKGLLLIIILALLAVGFAYWKKDNLEQLIPSKVEEGSKEITFIHTAKQFAFTVPEKWSVVEPLGGKQTLVYPSESKISGSDALTLINQDVIIVETAVNKKDSFDALITEMKAGAEKGGAAVTVENKDYGKLKAAELNINGKTSYRQVLFNTPTIIVLTSRINHPILGDLAKSLTIDLSEYASQVAEGTNLMRQTKQDIAAGKYSDVYKLASENLKKQKKEDEFANILKDVSVEFNNNVLIWGIYVNNSGIGTAVNVINQDKIVRRGSFFYVKEKGSYVLDGLRLSGKINYDKAKSTTPETTPKK